MSKKTPTSLSAKYALRSVTVLARVVLRTSVLFAVILVPCATPTLGLLNVTEPKAPTDTDESAAEEAISVQARARVVGSAPASPLLVPLRGGLRIATSSVAASPYSGHRLPKNLLAPLRC